MPPIREHDVALDNANDDDDMPPLVDNPQSMTYTFFADMTPASFSGSDPHSTSSPNPLSSLSPPLSPSVSNPNPISPTLTTGPTPSSSRISHGKKRDASYIPRPPNAFILFRSSFIRSQQVTGKVEGNHSNLSKIIGMYWKTLPPSEREAWEAKAVIAQAEHRTRYPDWRFRPGANALAKLKVKDGGRKVRAQGKDPPNMAGNRDLGVVAEHPEFKLDLGDIRDGDTRTKMEKRLNTKNKGKGKSREQDTIERSFGKAKAKGKAKVAPTKGKGKDSQQETRCAKIADLLMEGKTGVALEVAVEEWEGGRKRRNYHGRRDSTDITSGTSSMPVSWNEPAPSSPPLLPPATNSNDRLNLYREYHMQCTNTTDITTSTQPSSSLIPLDIGISTAETSSDMRPDTYIRRSRSRSPAPSTVLNTTPDMLAKPPLTHMYKRSLSAPASHHRLPLPSISVSPAALPDQQYKPVLVDRQWEAKVGEVEAEGTEGEDGEKIYDLQEGPRISMSTENMGYDDHEADMFGTSYLEQYSSTQQPYSPSDGSHAVEWTRLPDRQGLIAVIEDPFMPRRPKDKDKDSRTSSVTPPLPVSIPIPASSPLLSPDLLEEPANIDSRSSTHHHSPVTDYNQNHPFYYYDHAHQFQHEHHGAPHSPLTPLTPISPIPSSSFSTLAGWAGDAEVGVQSNWYPGSDQEYGHPWGQREWSRSQREQGKMHEFGTSEEQTHRMLGVDHRLEAARSYDEHNGVDEEMSSSSTSAPQR